MARSIRKSFVQAISPWDNPYDSCQVIDYCPVIPWSVIGSQFCGIPSSDRVVVVLHWRLESCQVLDYCPVMLWSLYGSQFCGIQASDRVAVVLHWRLEWHDPSQNHLLKLLVHGTILMTPAKCKTIVHLCFGVYTDHSFVVYHHQIGWW